MFEFLQPYRDVIIIVTIAIAGVDILNNGVLPVVGGDYSRIVAIGCCIVALAAYWFLVVNYQGGVETSRGQQSAPIAPHINQVQEIIHERPLSKEEVEHIDKTDILDDLAR